MRIADVSRRSWLAVLIVMSFVVLWSPRGLAQPSPGPLVVVSINGLAVRDADDVVGGVREAGPDGTVALGLIRDRKPFSVSIALKRP